MAIGTPRTSIMIVYCYPLAGYAVGSLALVADSFHMLKYVTTSKFFKYLKLGIQRYTELGRGSLCDPSGFGSTKTILFNLNSDSFYIIS